MNQRRTRTTDCTLSGGFAAMRCASALGMFDDAPVRRDSADDARLVCFLGAEESSGERNLRGEGAAAAGVEQAPKPRTAEATWCFGDLKACVDIGYDKIALERHTQTKPHDGAVYGGDHRFPVDRANEQIPRMGVGLLRAAEARERLGRPHLPLLNVGPAGECLAGPAEDRDPSFPITVEISECLPQRSHQIGVEGISLVRTVQRDRGDVPLPRIADERLAGVSHLIKANSSCE